MQWSRLADPDRLDSLSRSDQARLAAAAPAVLGAVAAALPGGRLARLAGGAAIGASTYLLVRGQHRLEDRVLDEVRTLWGLAPVQSGRPPFPAPGGWALSSHAITALLREVRVRRPRTILELGPGTSTVALGTMFPDVRIHGVEHHEVFADRVRETVATHGLDNCTIHHAPLAEHGWYDLAMVSAAVDGSIDVLLVDGPPNIDQQDRRHPSTQLADRITPGGIVLVDDTDRASEQRLVAQWLDRPGYRVIESGRDYTILERAAG